MQCHFWLLCDDRMCIFCHCTMKTILVEFPVTWWSPEDRPHDGGFCSALLSVQHWCLSVYRQVYACFMAMVIFNSAKANLTFPCLSSTLHTSSCTLFTPTHSYSYMIFLLTFHMHHALSETEVLTFLKSVTGFALFDTSIMTIVLLNCC